MVGYALASLAQQPIRAVKTMRRTVEAGLKIRETNRRQPDQKPPPSLFSAPHTSFNHALTPHRGFATASLSLDAVKEIKDAEGVKVNDVVLALCSGALRYYLDQRDEHPESSLVAMVPMSVRTEDEKGSHGNKVAAMLTSLATDIDDPLERLHAIHNEMGKAKEQQNAIGADTLQNWVDFAAPAVMGQAVRVYSRMKIADRHRPLFNVTISNVPGPPFPLYVAGAQLKATYPMGPIVDGGGLNITVMSYLDSLDFGFVVCPELIPEPWTLADAMHDALEQLTKAVAAKSTPAG
jgi:WS/DGAT/MGAT family acyltransferase